MHFHLTLSDLTWHEADRILEARFCCLCHSRARADGWGMTYLQSGASPASPKYGIVQMLVLCRVLRCARLSRDGCLIDVAPIACRLLCGSLHPDHHGTFISASQTVSHGFGELDLLLGEGRNDGCATHVHASSSRSAGNHTLHPQDPCASRAD